MTRLAIVLIVSALVSVAQAQSPQPASPSDAQALLDHGIQLFEKGDLDGALTELEQAYALAPTPDAGYALGQVLRKKGSCDRAIPYFRRAVAQSPSENFTRAAQYQIGRCVVENPSLAPPTAPPVENAALLATPTPAARVKWWRDPAGGALLGVGLASAVVGAALLGRAQVEAADSKDSLGAFHDAGNVTTLRIAGGVTLGVGGVLALGGIIRYAIIAKRRN